MDHLFRQQENTRVAVRPGLAQARKRGPQQRLGLQPISGTTSKSSTVREFFQSQQDQRWPTTGSGWRLAFVTVGE